MIVCGIDPAIRNVGIVIGEVAEIGDKPQILYSDTFSTKTQKRGDSSFHEGEYDVLCAKHLAQQLLVTLKRWKPKFISIEVGFGSRSRAAANGIGAAKGFIGAIMAMYDATYVMVDPEEAKSIVIKQADKALIMMWVRENIPFEWPGIKWKFEHQADSVVILIAGMKKYLMEQNNAVSRPIRKPKPRKRPPRKRTKTKQRRKTRS